MASAGGSKWVGYWRIPQSELELKDKIGSREPRNVYSAVWKTQGDLHVAAKQINVFFDREARVLANIRHENIVTLYACVVEPPIFTLVMELCDRGSLYDYVRDHNNPLDNELRQQWAMEIGKAMRYLHYEGLYKPIAHRNLTPTSIVLSTGPSRLIAKLCAFGYSKPLKELSEVTRGAFKTSVWISQEVLMGQRPTMESDVYGFAMILWYMATRQTEPFDPLVKELAYAEIIRGKRPVIPTDCPRHWPAVMEAGWKPDIKERPDFNVVMRMLEGIATDSEKQTSEPTKLKKWQIPSSDIAMCDDEPLGGNGEFTCVVKAVYTGTKYPEYNGKVVVAKQLERKAVRDDALNRFGDIALSDSHRDKTLVHILGIECSQTEASPYIIMELMESSVRKRLSDVDSFRKRYVRKFAKAIAAGLTFLHTRNPPHPHGRLSSSNVLYNTDGGDVCDIKLDDCYFTDLIPHGSVSGKHYTAPEVKLSKRPTLKGDIYSFGILLAEMYTCKDPSSEDGKRALNEIDWKSLQSLVEQCTNKSEAKRPTIQEVTKLLEDL